MEIVKADEYEDIAMEFQHQIVEILDKTLKEKGISLENRSDICGDFSFDLAMLLDEGSLKTEGGSFVPSLAFESGQKLLVNSGVLYHEYAFGVSSAYFEENA